MTIRDESNVYLTHSLFSGTVMVRNVVALSMLTFGFSTTCKLRAWEKRVSEIKDRWRSRETVSDGYS
jgi:hypothetical protein